MSRTPHPGPGVLPQQASPGPGPGTGRAREMEETMDGEGSALNVSVGPKAHHLPPERKTKTLFCVESVVCRPTPPCLPFAPASPRL